jgi:zinc protease
LAVLGEYNKNSAAPSLKMSETLRELAFDKHTYQHTTMGYLDDIKDMPNQYQYSRQFFDRYYRPEYTVILVSGDTDPAKTKALVEKYWGNWKRGTHKTDIPAEPPQKEPRTAKIDWPTPTLPWVITAFRVPAYSDTEKDMAALDVLSFLGFSESSPLYRKLVLDEQKVDVLSGGYQDHLDPYLFTVYTRVKKTEDMEYVREAVLSTLAGFKDTPVQADRLDRVKRHLRYRFALSMDNSEAIASTLAHYVALRPTPETLNRLYDLYDKVTPEDIREVARRYFVENGRSIVTLTGAAK